MLRVQQGQGQGVLAAFAPKPQLLRPRLQVVDVASRTESVSPPQLDGQSFECDQSTDLCFQLIHIEIRDSAVPQANIVDYEDMQYDALYVDMPSMEEQQCWDNRKSGPGCAYVFGVTP